MLASMFAVEYLYRFRRLWRTSLFFFSTRLVCCRPRCSVGAERARPTCAALETFAETFEGNVQGFNMF